MVDILIGVATGMACSSIGFWFGYRTGKAAGYWKGVNDARDAAR